MKWSIPERVIEEGRSLAKEDKVLSFTRDDERRIWYGEVMDSDMYYVELDGTAKEDDVCQCLYWQQYGYCKHTVAVELFMREEGVSRFIPKAVSTENQELKSKQDVKTVSPAMVFTKGFERLQDAELKRIIKESDNLDIFLGLDIVRTSEFHLEQSVIGLYIRLGRKSMPGKSYIIKQLDEFLGAYMEERDIRLNTQLWHISPMAFSKQQQKLIEKMIAIKEEQDIVGQTLIATKTNVNKRYLVLNNEQVRFFIEESSYTDLRLVGEGLDIRDMTIHQGKLPLSVELRPVGLKDYDLRINDPFPVYLEHYQWAIGKVGIYELSNEQAPIYQVLRQMLKRLSEPVIHYTEQEVSSLFSYVLPQLAILSDFDLPESLDHEVIRESLKAHLFFEKHHTLLKVRAEFHYGKYIFSNDPTTESTYGEEGAVLRDKVQEERLILLLRHFGYGTYGVDYNKVFPDHYERYRFFTTEIPTFETYATVHLSPEIERLYLNPETHQPRANITENGSWFDIEFDISSVDESEVNDVLLSLIKNESYHQLNNGQVLLLDDEAYKETSDVLRQLREDIQFKHHHIEVPTYRGLLLNDTLAKLSSVETSTSFENMVEELTQPNHDTTHLPKGLKTSLRDYQVVGFNWFKTLSKYQFGGILADDMGLGKTVQTITYLLSEKVAGHLNQPSLIIAPASLIYNWKLEFKRFAPDLLVDVVVGAKKERIEQISKTSRADVVIVSYATLRQDVSLFKKQSYHSIILDEAQMIKNASTKTFQAIVSLTSNRKFALSGTPIENRLEELWAIFKFLMPGFFPSLRKFKQLETSVIATMIQPFVLRRVKKDVLDDLPDKIETDLYSQLTEEQKTLYVAHLKQMQETLSSMSSGDFNKQRLSILAGLTRLRQICCDPTLFMEDYEGGSGKLDQALELIEQARSNGRRMLLFSQFTGMLSIIEKELDKRGISSFYLRGSTPVKERQYLVDRFNRGEKDVFLISLKAGGTGLNLTGADTVILYDLWWNPAVEEQATGRAHRIGQTKKVEVWRLMAEGTIEEKMNQLQLEKKKLFQQVLHSEDTKELSSMSMEDIQHILEFGEAQE